MPLELLSLETVQDLAHRFGYVTVFLGILLENAGIPLPGETITVVGGFLAGSGELRLSGVLACAIGGAILGDSCGYWLGRWGGWPLLHRMGQWFRFSEGQLISVRDRFSRNAPQAVFLGRFIALLRIFAGPLAGIAGMPYKQFLLYNAMGAVLWGGITVGLSYFLGQVVPLEQIMHWLAQLGLFALGIVALVVIAQVWLHRRQERASL
ncbi:DedA family protein [Synechococcus elongatus]|uniref:DedA family protein n=1 Tax=Synechococcus elongatus PCC 11802 TaxID=2283154 RepID=A0AAT9JV92_SYNEL|nr:DedA family protein [Synechococcus elongatus]